MFFCLCNISINYIVGRIKIIPFCNFFTWKQNSACCSSVPFMITWSPLTHSVLVMSSLPSWLKKSNIRSAMKISLNSEHEFLLSLSWLQFLHLTPSRSWRNCLNIFLLIWPSNTPLLARVSLKTLTNLLTSMAEKIFSCLSISLCSRTAGKFAFWNGSKL